MRYAPSIIGQDSTGIRIIQGESRKAQASMGNSASLDRPVGPNYWADGQLTCQRGLRGSAVVAKGTKGASRSRMKEDD